MAVSSHIYFLTLSDILIVSSVFSLDIISGLVTQIEKNLPVMQETRVHSYGQEDPQEKGMAIHCSILVWRIP